MSLCEGFLSLFVDKAARGRYCSSPLPTPDLLTGIPREAVTQSWHCKYQEGCGRLGDTWYEQSQHKNFLPDGKSTFLAEMQGWIYRLFLKKQKQM